MNTETFKISGCGIDLCGLRYCPLYKDYIFDYLHTSIEDNNDYLIADFIKYQSGSPLVTTLPGLSDLGALVSGHLSTIGRARIDLALIPLSEITNTPSQELLDLLGLGIIDEIGIDCTSHPDLGELKEACQTVKRLYSKEVRFISMALCPLHFKYDVVKWAIENRIDILGFNPFGGKLSSYNMIQAFTASYLLGFSATYSTLVFLSGSDMGLAISSAKYLQDLVGKELEAKYILKKSVSRLQKPLKPVITSSVQIAPDIILPSICPGSITNPDETILSLTGFIEKIPEDNKSNTEISGIKDYLEMLPKMQTEPYSWKIRFALIRYGVIKYLKLRYPGWYMSISYISDQIAVISVSRNVTTGFLGLKDKIETKSYILSVSLSSPEYYII